MSTTGSPHPTSHPGSAPIPRLRIIDHARVGDACHFNRMTLRPEQQPTLHCHDFHEVFWVEEGDGWEHRPRDSYHLIPGTVALVAADDAHGFSSDPGRRCRMANLAFRCSLWDELRQTAFADEPDVFAPEAPRRFDLPVACVRELTQFAAELDRGARRVATAQRFLLNLLWLIRTQQAAASTQVPRWLSEAVASLDAPAALQLGTHALTRRSGKSAEHLAREIRRWFDKTPTDLVNDARITWAAQQLAASDDSPLEICLECGLTNLGHFYRLFRARMGTSPQRWREQQRRIVQPAALRP